LNARSQRLRAFIRFQTLPEIRSSRQPFGPHQTQILSGRAYQRVFSFGLRVRESVSAIGSSARRV